MGGMRRRLGRDKKCLQNSERNTWREETTAMVYV
jgi:hypothetical protein